MPRAYQPPLNRRPQAVPPAVPSRRDRDRRLWLLLPLLGLLPLAIAVLASEWPFGGGNVNQPVAAPTLAAAPTSPGLNPTPVPTTVLVTLPTSTSLAPVTAASPTALPAGAASPSIGTSAAPNTSGNANASSAIASASGLFRSYRVQPGDTVKFVAQMYGVSPASIANASGLSNPDQVRVGQVLTIPAQPGWLYRIQPGETMDQIAARTGVPLDNILSASRLSTASVRAGDVILIPDLTAARSK